MKKSLFIVAWKNWKITMLVGIALYILVADNEEGTEVYNTATKKGKARIIFDETHNMIKQSEELNKFIKKRKSDLYFHLIISKIQLLVKNSHHPF